MSEIDSAYEIAVRDLRACYTENGIFAGLTHFTQYWARDCFFASLGATKLKDFEVVKKQLRLFLKFQKKNGLLPGLITSRLKPNYRPLFSHTRDGNALFVIAFMDYVNASKDFNFAKENFEKVKKALEWLKSRDIDRDGLIEEPPLANWADSVFKFGKVLYSNCCYFKALTSFSELCERVGEKSLATRYFELSAYTKESINQKFWFGNYYADWIDFFRHTNFSSDGNLLSIIWEIADESQGQLIESFLKQKRLNKVPVKTNWPPYPFWRVPIILLPFEAYHYHNGLSWMWLGCLNVMALKKLGWSKEAKNELKKIAKLINENETVHEIFNGEGKPVDSFALKSEHPFAWSAALYIKAYNELKNK